MKFKKYVNQELKFMLVKSFVVVVVDANELLNLNKYVLNLNKYVLNQNIKRLNHNIYVLNHNKYVFTTLNTY